MLWLQGTIGVNRKPISIIPDKHSRPHSQAFVAADDWTTAYRIVGRSIHSSWETNVRVVIVTASQHHLVLLCSLSVALESLRVSSLQLLLHPTTTNFTQQSRISID